MYKSIVNSILMSSPVNLYFKVDNGQSNCNGFNKFNLTPYTWALCKNGNKIWNQDTLSFENPSLGHNVVDTTASGDAHGTELPQANQMLGGSLSLQKTARNGTALLFDWYAGSDLDNQAQTELAAAWNAYDNKTKAVKVFKWDQWESSVSRNESAGYKQAFLDLVARRESIVGKFDYILIHKANPNTYSYGLGDPGEGDRLLAIQVELVAENDNMYLIDSDDLDLEIDDIHYPSLSQEIRSTREIDVFCNL